MKQILKTRREIQRMNDLYREQMERVAMQIVMAYGGVTPELNNVRLAIDSDGDICVYHKGEQQMDFDPELVRKMMRWIVVVGYCVASNTPGIDILEADLDNEGRKEDGDERFRGIDFAVLRDKNYWLDSFSMTTDDWQQCQKFVLTEHDPKKLYEECISMEIEGDFDKLDVIPIMRLLGQWGEVIGDRIVWFHEEDCLLSY